MGRMLVTVILVSAVAAASAQAAARPVAPATTGTTLEGKRVSLADFMGRPVLINVWSSW
ncbi:MAG: TlpA family protein disulfide reductase [Gaiella sp.]